MSLFDCRQRVLVLDGALATELERAGLLLNSSLWSALVIEESPDVIMNIHLSYLRAGADIISTSSYQASLEGLLNFGFSRHKSVEIMKKSAALAIGARESYLKDVKRPVYVAGSCGPYGAFMADGSEYSGDYALSSRDYVDFHFHRIKVLIQGGVDLIAFETFPRLDEAIAVYKMMKSRFPETPFWISFVSPRGKFTGGGDSIAQLGCSLLPGDNFLGIGINCSHPKAVSPFLYEAAKSFSGDFIVYPNSGEGFDLERGTWTGDLNNGLFQENVLLWKKLGAKVMGGCCRTSSETIALIKRTVLGNVSNNSE